MQPIELLVNGVGTTQWIPMDYHRDPFNIGFGVSLGSGVTATYTVQHTFISVPELTNGRVPTGNEIFNHETIVDQTESNDGNYAFPISAMRLNVTVSDGDVSFFVIQAGIRGG